MTTLIDFANIDARLADFNHPRFHERYQQSNTLRALAHTLVALEWEGTPDILSDVFSPQKTDLDTYRSTLERLDYQCVIKQQQLDELDKEKLPLFIEFEQFSVILVAISDDTLHLYDYKNDILITHPKAPIACKTCSVTTYSTLFREPPPASQDKSNWLKYTFYRYNSEIKNLMGLSLIINLLGTMQPFFIMSVYNFALTSGSKTTLFGLTFLAIFLILTEVGFKQLRMNILATSGKDLSLHISKSVISKLLWLPYSMTSSAGVSSQIARLRDIDQFRKLVTAESSLSYFDMPFVFLFIIAITLMSGMAALTVLGGIFFMLIFCFYARYIYTQVSAKSSRANAIVSYQWNEILRNIQSIQGLPLLNVLRARFSAAQTQSLEDSQKVGVTNGRIQSLGQALIQVIGTASIVTAVFGVMEGTTNAGAMLAIIILVWKALGPIMGIYNAIAKFKSLNAAALQINALMSLNDDSASMEKSPPINQFEGQIIIDGLTHRYQGRTQGLTNLSVKIAQGDKISVSGVSGSGKTTFLNILAGLEENYQGSVLIDDYNIKQFNRFRYRNAINYIPFHLHLFEGNLASNFILHNGVITAEKMQYMIDFFDLNPWLPNGLKTDLTHEFTQSLPSGVLQSLRLAIGLAQDASIVIIDEPFVGCEKEKVKYLSKLFSDQLANTTVIFSTTDLSLIAASNNCLLLAPDGAQKYYGFPDKVLQSQGG